MQDAFSAGEIGRLSSFIVNGRAFSSAELDKCNSAAKGGPAPALAQY